MKKNLTLLLALLITTICLAQQGINYKAQLKDTNGNPLATFMNVQFTIHSASEVGTIVYQEDHNYTTDANGLLILTIGTDLSPSIGVFEAIDWSADLHFLNTTITYSAGTIDFGTTQFLAVPYAKQALKASFADNISTKLNDLEDAKSDSDGTENGSSIFIGLDAGANDDSSDNKNVGVGFQALNSNIVGTGNVALGYKAGFFETGINKLYIDNSDTNTPLIFGDFNTDKVTVNGEFKATGKVGFNTDQMIGSSDFVIRAQGNFFGGMYIDSPNTTGNGKPFYGYALNGQAKAYDYFDGVDNIWKFQFVEDNVPALKLTETGELFIKGKLAINTEAQINSNTSLTIRALTDDFGGMYIDSPDSIAGKPFYGYSINGLTKAFSYFDEVDDTWKLNIEGANILRITDEQLSIAGSIQVANKSGAQSAGTIYYDGANFYGIISDGQTRQLDNTTNAQSQAVNTAQLNLEIQSLTETNTLLTNIVNDLEARLAQIEFLLSERD